LFSKILIANRGEIAVRIIRACKEMGVATVAVYSEADRNAMHVGLADESYCIGPALLKYSYLNMGAILTVAVASGAQAIHPGYGLLSENPKFAALCEQCGINFIGPSSDTIAKMGDKNQARVTMKNAGVPVIPGSELIKDAAQAKEEAKKIGYPVMLKARSGGGGRGIRIVKARTKWSPLFLPPRRRPGARSATERFISRNTCRRSSISRCSLSATNTETSYAWASASVRFSARTKRLSRKARRRL